MIFGFKLVEFFRRLLTRGLTFFDLDKAFLLGIKGPLPGIKGPFPDRRLGMAAA